MKHLSNCHNNDVEKAIDQLQKEFIGQRIIVGNPTPGLVGVDILKSQGIVGLYLQELTRNVNPSDQLLPATPQALVQKNEDEI